MTGTLLKRRVVASLIASSCLPVCLGLLPAHAATFMASNPYFALRLGTAATSADASHEASFNASAGELEAGRVQLLYPSAFAFHGFATLGSANTQIGTLSSSLNAVGPPTGTTVPVRSRDDNSAYGDADGNGVYTPGLDPSIEYQRFRATQALTVYLPLGGDLNAGTTLAPVNLRMSVLLNQGLFTNPINVGLYTVSANLTSVDPDNDGLDDSAGDSPQTFATSIVLAIGGDDLCSTGPSERCLDAGNASIKIKKGATDAQDLVRWKWRHGQQFLKTATGDPANTTSYALCIYDGSAGRAVFRTGLTVGAGASWADKGLKGWAYVDVAGTAQGATKILLKPAISGLSKVKFVANGTAVPMPTPVGGEDFLDQTPNVIAQLLNSDGSCWSSEFTTAIVNEPTRFRARTP